MSQDSFIHEAADANINTPQGENLAVYRKAGVARAAADPTAPYQVKHPDGYIEPLGSSGGGVPGPFIIGSMDASGNPDYPAASAGEAYRIVVSGKIGGAAGIIVEQGDQDTEDGDIIYALADNPGGDQATVGSAWTIWEGEEIRLWERGTGVNSIEQRYSNSVANGVNSIATGNASIANGDNSNASGNGSQADGIGSTATGNGSFTEGDYSHAEGNGSVAEGAGSHSEGSSTSVGVESHAEGQSTTATGAASHSEGQETDAVGIRSHAEGMQTVANGANSHSEGIITQANGVSSHAEGNETVASGAQSHSEGLQTDATGVSSHAEGAQTTASGESSHSEGTSTTASGDFSHSEGQGTTSSADNSHSGGVGAQASHFAEWARSSAADGESQYGTVSFAGKTAISQTPTEIFLDGTFAAPGSLQLTIPINTTYSVKIKAVSVDPATGDSIRLEGTGLIKNVAGVTSIVGGPISVASAQADASVGSTTVDATADDVNDALKIEVSSAEFINVQLFFVEIEYLKINHS